MNVLHWGNAWEHRGPAVLHSEWWIRAHWGRAFDILQFAPHGFDGNPDDPSGGQGWVILRKRPIVISPGELEAVEPSEPREWQALQHNLRQIRWRRSDR